jgi:chemotaxis protein methyltransferase CheR
MPELGIVDIREIIRVVKSEYDYDFANYALTSFKQRLERIITLYNLGNSEGLIRKLRNESAFFDIFMNELVVPTTEMFRDPSLWRWLRDEFFTSVLGKYAGRFKIWLPGCVSGAELYSLVILLSESGLLDKVNIIVSCISDKSIETIRKGLYDFKKQEVSEENYRRFNGSRELASYYSHDENFIFKDTPLIRNVEFMKLNIDMDHAPQNIRLVLFRNNMIYFNPTHQEKILKVLYDSLSPSGYLVIGIRERISGFSNSWDFEVINEAESVYRKRLI